MLDAFESGRVPYDRVMVFARAPRPSIEARVLRLGGSVVYDLDTLIAARPAVVLEAAGHDAVRAYALPIVKGGLDVILMSIGALADEAIRTPLEDTARQHGATVWLPSGGVGGLDASQRRGPWEIWSASPTARPSIRWG